MLNKLLENYEKTINSYLTRLYNEAAEITVQKGSGFIIFSDLHMGNGRKNDDFKKNAEIFNSALQEYYFNRNYTLVLNGDIEELQKFNMSSIRSRWADTYRLFDNFAFEDRLIKITGNHDDNILSELNDQRYNEQQAVKLIGKNNATPIFIFHGHQASVYYRYLNRLNSFLLRYIVNPVGIRNFSKKHRHMKKMRIEKRSYNFSRTNRIISIIGHTHRPLFESLSRADSLHFSIETLLRMYRKADFQNRKNIELQILELKRKYDICIDSKPEYEPASLLYSKGIPVPCLFNTGCTIGKRGITGIEVTSDTISLVHWFDSRVSNRFLFNSEPVPEPLEKNTTIHKVVLRSDKLDYIFDSINLLSGVKKTGELNPLVCNADLSA